MPSCGSAPALVSAASPQGAEMGLESVTVDSKLRLRLPLEPLFGFAPSSFDTKIPGYSTCCNALHWIVLSVSLKH